MIVNTGYWSLVEPHVHRCYFISWEAAHEAQETVLDIRTDSICILSVRKNKMEKR